MPAGGDVRLAVVGGGSWGTAFALLQARRHRDVALWVREEEVCRQIARDRRNDAFLPGFSVPPQVRPTTSLAEALAGRTIVAFAVPSHYLREVALRAAPHVSEAACVVSLVKGIENTTLLRMTEVLAQALPRPAQTIAALSGPTFAREVAEGKPTGATVAAPDASVAARLQAALAGDRFRLYADTDVAGVELGGALKNVLAVAAGMADGLGFGHNARALLIARGLAEMARLGLALGASERTFAGLSGLGDLVLTCTGDLSRNRMLGLRVGRGERPADVVASMRMVAEGYHTARAAAGLAARCGVAMPIVEQVYLILHEGKDVRTAVSELFARALRSEKD